MFSFAAAFGCWRHNLFPERKSIFSVSLQEFEFKLFKSGVTKFYYIIAHSNKSLLLWFCTICFSITLSQQILSFYFIAKLNYCYIHNHNFNCIIDSPSTKSTHFFFERIGQIDKRKLIISMYASNYSQHPWATAWISQYSVTFQLYNRGTINK